MALEDDDIGVPETPGEPYRTPYPPAQDHVALIDLTVSPMLTLVILGFSGFILLINGSAFLVLLPLLLGLGPAVTPVTYVLFFFGIVMFPVGILQILFLYRLYKLQPATLHHAKIACLVAALLFLAWTIYSVVMYSILPLYVTVDPLNVIVIAGNLLCLYLLSADEVRRTFGESSSMSNY